jgi:DNA-binding response OmpR family regulator
LNILIADDDKAFGSVLKQELENVGYTVDLAKNGVEAVLSFLSKSQDCVLLDMDMPRLRGVDALKIIKKLNPTVPIITFSGTVNGEIEEALESGAIKSLIKPFGINELKNDIKNYILR